MIIHPPKITEEDDVVSVSARVTIGTPGVQAPETLWFKFPLSCRAHLTDRSDCFVAGLLSSAMALGETVVVEGTTSPRLAHGLREYQHVLNAWWPDRFRIVAIEYGALGEAVGAPSHRAVGSAFSGGVDSFYTLWKHLKENEPFAAYRITHCMLINGFDKDVDLDGTGTFGQLHQSYVPLMERLGITLLTARTNLQQFRLSAMRRGDLHLSFAAPITACALAFGNLFSAFYIPGSYTYAYDNLIPEGAHPILDHLLSTEAVQLIHDGADVPRTEKIARMAHWTEARSGLRVCLEKARFNPSTGALENCCACEKCVRTMITLDLLNVLPEFGTFPQSLRRRQIRKTLYRTEGSRIFFRENLQLALSRKRNDRARDLRHSWFRSQFLYPVYSRLRNLIRNP
jgi:hypothetical protein